MLTVCITNHGSNEPMTRCTGTEGGTRSFRDRLLIRAEFGDMGPLKSPKPGGEKTPVFRLPAETERCHVKNSDGKNHESFFDNYDASFFCDNYDASFFSKAHADRKRECVDQSLVNK